jgi:hypothetical protein
MGIELTKLNERLVAIPPLQTSSLPQTMRRAIPNSSSGEGWQRKTVKQKRKQNPPPDPFFLQGKTKTPSIKRYP